jgi:hypothetical protein
LSVWVIPYLEIAVFHVVHPLTGWHIFLVEDPRNDGFQGDVQENATFSAPEDLHDWPDGADRSMPCLGRSAVDPTVYHEFHTQQECVAAGFTPLAGRGLAKARWSQVPGHDGN